MDGLRGRRRWAPSSFALFRPSGRSAPRPWRWAAVVVVLVVGDPVPAGAVCNVIPGPTGTFRSTLGIVDRPFASPRDLVKVHLRTNPECGPARSFASGVADQVVSLVFKPRLAGPAAGPAHVIVLATDCGDVGSCDPIATTRCIPVRAGTDGIALGTPDADSLVRELTFRFPVVGQCVGGRQDGAMCTAPSDETTDDCPGGHCSDDRSEGFTLTGPVAIAVTDRAAPLPCGLVSAPCTSEPGVRACIDELFSNDDGEPCSTVPHAVFPHFTALPLPNDYRAICTDPVPPCTGTSGDIRFTVDAGGNLLAPMLWSGIQVYDDEVPVPRTLRLTTTAEAFEGGGEPIHVPDDTFLASYTERGVKVAPVFDPQVDDGAGAQNELALFGAADGARSVLRIARRSPALVCAAGERAGEPCSSSAACNGAACGTATCVGGDRAGEICTGEGGCPAGTCRPGLFDFSSRLLAGVGPIVVRSGACLGGGSPLRECGHDDRHCPDGQCVDLAAVAADPVPLDGLAQTETMNAFVLDEAVAGKDLNGDRQIAGSVLVLQDRDSGETQALGAPRGCHISGEPKGRAIARVHAPPFSFPAVAAAADVVAFLEVEQLEKGCDENDDGDLFDTVVRVFQRAPAGRRPAKEITTGARGVDAAPLLNGRSLVVSPDSAGRPLVFFRASESADTPLATARVSVAADGTEGDADSGGGPDTVGGGFVAISATGRFVAFASRATNLDGAVADTNGADDVFLHDRDRDGNGIFDEPGGIATECISTAPDGASADGASGMPAISDDGRFVTFKSTAGNLTGDPVDPSVYGGGVFLRDRCLADGLRIEGCTPATTRIGTAEWVTPALSGDGSVLVFAAAGCRFLDCDLAVRHLTDPAAGDERITVGNLWPGLGPFVSRDGRMIAFGITEGEEYSSDRYHVAVYDRGTGGPVRLASVDAHDQPLDQTQNSLSALSADGRYVYFLALGLDTDVPGCPQGGGFVRDLLRGRTECASLTTSGDYLHGWVGNNSISGDGRFVTYDNRLRDRLLGLTVPIEVPLAGGKPTGRGGAHRISADGRFVAFDSPVTTLVARDTNGARDVFVRGVDLAHLGTDVTGNGRIGETVLQVLDAGTGGRIGSACPATDVAVSEGRAAFLRPETAGNAAGCPEGELADGGVDLDHDGDHDDRVVHLWRPEGVTNLGVAATSVALSTSHVAALVSECDMHGPTTAGCPTGGRDLNGDGDASDLVVHVQEIVGADPRTWVNLARAADALEVAGSIVAFLTPEAAENGSGPGCSATGGVDGTDLNGDGDCDDHVLQVYDAANGVWLVGPGAAARPPVAAGIVMGGRPGCELIAFRTSEAAESAAPLNGDEDAADDVLQVYDVAHRTVVNTGSAVTPCQLEACDPRIPYRVGEDTVTFLTFEQDQGADLGGEKGENDLILQHFNVRQVAGACESRAAMAARTLTVKQQSAVAPAFARHVLGSVHAGRCVGGGTAGSACVSDDGCGSGTCAVPLTRCVAEGAACDPEACSGDATGKAAGAACTCAPDDLCESDEDGAGRCARVAGSCSGPSDCSAGQECRIVASGVQRLTDPLAGSAGGGTVFTSAGRCLETIVPGSGDPACPLGIALGTSGLCEREHGSCATDDDCTAPSRCDRAPVVVTAADADRDEVPDRFDNCPALANVDQADADGDGVGDACEAARAAACGNGVIDAGEQCDDGNLVDGDACSSTCTLCNPAPRTDCRRAAARASRLGIANARGGSLEWSWRSDAPLPATELGDPLGGARYALCLYDVAAGSPTSIEAPSASNCPAGPCWRVRPGHDLTYGSRRPRAGEVSRLRLFGSPRSPTRIDLSAVGSATVPALPLAPTVTAQLTNSDTGVCWEATYRAPRHNSGSEFSAVND